MKQRLKRSVLLALFICIALMNFSLVHSGAIYAQGTPPAPQPQPSEEVTPEPAEPREPAPTRSQPPPEGTPSVPPDPTPDADSSSYQGCGNQGQECCKKLGAYYCKRPWLFNDDPLDPVLYDEFGRRLNAFTSQTRSAERCLCEQKFQDIGKSCEIYFTPSNRENRHFMEWLFFSAPDQPQEEIDRLKNELFACKKCTLTGGIYTALGCVTASPGGIIGFLLTVGIGLSGVFALLCIIYSAIILQTSKGDSEKVTKSKERVTACIIGLILILFSIFIVNFFGSGILGFNIQNLEFFIPETVELQCNRECVYSQEVAGETKCFTGACPEGARDCGRGTGVAGINKGCTFAPSCDNFEQVACPTGSVPIPAPEPPVTVPPGTPSVPNLQNN